MNIIHLFVVNLILNVCGFDIVMQFTAKASQTMDLFTLLLLDSIFILGWGIEGHELASIFRDTVLKDQCHNLFYHIHVAINSCLLRTIKKSLIIIQEFLIKENLQFLYHMLISASLPLFNK